MISKCLEGSWLGFEKLGLIQGHAMVVTCQLVGRGVIAGSSSKLAVVYDILGEGATAIRLCSTIEVF